MHHQGLNKSRQPWERLVRKGLTHWILHAQHLAHDHYCTMKKPLNNKQERSKLNANNQHAYILTMRILNPHVKQVMSGNVVIATLWCFKAL